MSSNFQYQSGIGHSAAYQVAGRPFLTGSKINQGEEVSFTFPAIARSITVKNVNNVEIRVHFASKNIYEVYNNYHYWTLPHAEDSVTFDIKCKTIFISNEAADDGKFELFAELTGIGHDYILTGEGIDS